MNFDQKLVVLVVGGKRLACRCVLRGWLLASLCVLTEICVESPWTAAEQTAEKAIPGRKTYTARANLLVLPWARFPRGYSPATQGPTAIESFAAAQAQLISSPLVVTAALQQPKVKALPSVQQEEKHGTALAWLTRQLRINFSDKNSEIMTISVTASDPREAATLANAVVQSYFEEVVNKGQIDRRARLSELQNVFVEKDTDVRAKRTEMKKSSKELGIEDEGFIEVKERLAIEQLLLSQKELAGLKSDLRRFRGDVKLQKILNADSKRQEARVQVFEEMVKEGEKEMAQHEKEVRQMIALESLYDDVKSLERVLHAVAEERERLRVELRAPSRVRILGDPNQPADVPENPD